MVLKPDLSKTVKIFCLVGKSRHGIKSRLSYNMAHKNMTLKADSVVI